ncbi:MAG: hypothetical protein KA118_16660 [Verrucomicrobia bacterium]|nr:hypothetical protein [Verrucomicrobiota bacterium]
MIQVVAFGVMVCTIASAALALAPAFRAERTGFVRRLLFFFWRFSLPAWAALELVTLVWTGRLYP